VALVGIADRGDAAGMARRGQPVADRRADSAALHRPFGARGFAGDQQQQARPAGDRGSEPVVEQLISGGEVVAVEIERAVRRSVLRLSGSARYVGKSRLGIGPILGEPQGDWLDTRIGARLEGDRHAWSLIVSNLLDETGNRFALGSPFTLIEHPQITPLRPRTVRLGWEIRF